MPLEWVSRGLTRVILVIGELRISGACRDLFDFLCSVIFAQSVNVFETTIRVLGGLLAAFHLSGEEVLLEKADNLGRRLAKAFESP